MKTIQKVLLFAAAMIQLPQACFGAAEALTPEQKILQELSADDVRALTINFNALIKILKEKKGITRDGSDTKHIAEELQDHIKDNLNVSPADASENKAFNDAQEATQQGIVEKLAGMVHEGQEIAQDQNMQHAIQTVGTFITAVAHADHAKHQGESTLGYLLRMANQIGATAQQTGVTDAVGVIGEGAGRVARRGGCCHLL